MTNELFYAFNQLRVSERTAVLQALGYNFPHHGGETGADFCKKALRKICSDGRVRDLEEEMRRFQ